MIANARFNFRCLQYLVLEGCNVSHRQKGAWRNTYHSWLTKHSSRNKAQCQHKNETALEGRCWYELDPSFLHLRGRLEDCLSHCSSIAYLHPNCYELQEKLQITWKKWKKKKKFLHLKKLNSYEKPLKNKQMRKFLTPSPHWIFWNFMKGF